MIRGHGGNIYDVAQNIGCSPDDIIDMSSNTNPLGPVPGLIEYLRENLKAIFAFPEVDSNKLIKSFANYYKIRAEQVLAGNGTTQFIYTLPLALGTKKALVLGPTYADYGDACQMHRIDCAYVMAKEANLFQSNIMDIRACLGDIDTVFICNPNNPTGSLITRTDLVKLCEAYPGIRFLIDESYLPFTEEYDETTMIQADLSNVIVIHSFSKIFGIPGLRLGFLIASSEIIEQFKRLYQPWCVNSLAQIAGDFLLEHFLADNNFLKETQAFVVNEKHLLEERLKNTKPLKLFPSMASFVLIKIKERFDAGELCSMMVKGRVLFRDCSNFKGLSDRFVRITLKSSDINAMVADRIWKIFV
ncbi:MAG: pyridoxal phosphate-dependent class II aminotransferase [Deltaproteobacteria bacterium]|nr:pyridoxal phosphate-dependent class II aminotransferase [Deltaproteobacteria bacterium]